ncbi:MAG: SH3 domain-containing protein, partial [Lachnospiraceae bacterium]|nr:SH3 domain-containing protein [Lachnospiraceae bacterium]
EEDEKEEEEEEESFYSKPAPAEKKKAAAAAKGPKTSKAALQKESKRFWIFTAIIAVLTIAAIIFILISRGVFDKKDPTTPPTVPSQTAQNQTDAPTEEPTTDAPTEAPTEAPTDPPTEEPTTDPNQDERLVVLTKYDNLFVVNTPTLNVREEPNASSTKIATIDNFAGGSILEDLGGWFKISSGGITGYVSADFVITGERAKQSAVGHAEKLVRAAGSPLINVRTAPSTTNSQVIEKVGPGTVFDYLGEENGFYHIRYAGHYEGYISMDYAEYDYFLREAVRLQLNN